MRRTSERRGRERHQRGGRPPLESGRKTSVQAASRPECAQSQSKRHAARSTAGAVPPHRGPCHPPHHSFFLTCSVIASPGLPGTLSGTLYSPRLASGWGRASAAGGSRTRHLRSARRATSRAPSGRASAVVPASPPRAKSTRATSGWRASAARAASRRAASRPPAAASARAARSAAAASADASAAARLAGVAGAARRLGSRQLRRKPGATELWRGEAKEGRRLFSADATRVSARGARAPDVARLAQARDGAEEHDAVRVRAGGGLRPGGGRAQQQQPPPQHGPDSGRSWGRAL